MTNQNNYSKLPQNLFTGHDIKTYFQMTTNPYTSFISLKESQKAWVDNETYFEIHHKIPRHANGPDIPENCIPLSYEDHTEAHKLLYEVYGNHYDFCAFNMRIGKTAEAHLAFRKGLVDQMKNRNQGRFNSENQRKCGLQNKGVVKKPHAKSKYVIAAFQKGMFWVSSTGQEIHIPPGSMQSIGQLADKLLFAFSEKHQQNYTSSRTRSYIYVGLNKLVSGWRDPKTNKCIFRVGPWKLGGLYIDPEFFLKNSQQN
jgi:hypothetical protein